MTIAMLDLEAFWAGFGDPRPEIVLRALELLNVQVAIGDQKATMRCIVRTEPGKFDTHASRITQVKCLVLQSEPLDLPTTRIGEEAFPHRAIGV